ncbi:Gp49 family protein [Diaphorobacter nitroreducens]
MTQPIIKPTVGRVVWFHPCDLTGEAGFARHEDGQPYAAIIARVWSDALVNLTVLDANGTAHPRTSVALVQDGGGAPQYGSYCEWMPYQKGQAAKAEAAEKAASAPAPAEYRQPSQREQLEYALVSGTASRLAQTPNQAGQIAEGIKTVLNSLHSAPALNIPHAGTSRETVASDLSTFSAEEISRGKDHIGIVLTKLPVLDPCPSSLEREIQAKASAAPRVTPADIEAEIVSEHYFTAADGVQGAYRAGGDVHAVGGTPSEAAHQTLDLLTFCVLVLRNGFTATGESACASPENFNAEIGRKIARENAINKVWPLLGFRLRDKLAG